MLKNIKQNAKKIDKFIVSYLNKQNYSDLVTVMKYGTLYGGKKIRSSIIINTSRIFNIKPKKVLNICAAVECIHSYSLIHDDLPCMDNDKFRRGKPSTHYKFGESTAILAGNSLLTLAFEMIADKKFNFNPKIKLNLIKKLSECSGHLGIAGGQFLDLNYEKKKINLKKIINMQKKKTGKLFEFCCLAPAIIANKNTKVQKEMSKVGEELGLLFQVADDLLDVRGSKQSTGKPVQKDRKKGKSTLLNLFGYKKTLEFALERKNMIINKLKKKHGRKSDKLVQITDFLINRNY